MIEPVVSHAWWQAYDEGHLAGAVFVDLERWLAAPPSAEHGRHRCRPRRSSRSVTACHNLLVMEHVGLGRGRLYPGSWSQYASDPDRPVEL
jgi:3-mercaptopyruvate sulfurtransferase SseA